MVKYDWDLWMDGEVHEAIEGKDFTCKRKSFVTTLRHQAFYAATKVSLDNTERGVRFVFGDDPVLPERPWRWHKGEKVYEDA